MSPAEAEKADLLWFVTRSLYFCGTRIENLRGPQLMKVINQYYMPIVQAGWTVPLAFVLDVSAMLLLGGVAYTDRWKDARVPAVLTKLAQDYYRMLQTMRGHPLFAYVSRLVAGASSEERRDASIQVFLRFLLAELGNLPEIVAFRSRQLTVHSMRPSADKIEGVSVTTAGGRLDNKKITFLPPDQILSEPSVSLLAQLMRSITDYYTEHSLDEFISNEERFMIDYAARSDRSMERMDYHLLHRILSGPEVPAPETWPPLSMMLEEMIPTESYQQDGQVGGYVDINRKRLAEAMSEILPSEFALYRTPQVMFHNMINEGVMHYIREDIERIEPELRVLFFFVIDTSRLMLHAPRRVHARCAPGTTAWILSKALMADIVRDLGRYFPRRNVRAETVWYLWSPEDTPGYRDTLDLFAMEPASYASRYAAATHLAESAPAFFYSQLHKKDQREFTSLEPGPWKSFESLGRNRTYHCRHLVLFTSPATCRPFMPPQTLDIRGDRYGRDSLWVLHNDPAQPTVGILRPDSLPVNSLEARGVLTEERLRSLFLEEVLAKAAARRPPTQAAEIGGM